MRSFCNTTAKKIPKSDCRGYTPDPGIVIKMAGRPIKSVRMANGTRTMSTIESQIPSFADEDLRGFSGGFASGKYGLIVPFYNAVFSGKVARFIAITDDMTGNVQELNLIVDRDNPGLYKGFRGGFVSLWQGFYDAV